MNPEIAERCKDKSNGAILNLMEGCLKKKTISTISIHSKKKVFYYSKVIESLSSNRPLYLILLPNG